MRLLQSQRSALESMQLTKAEINLLLREVEHGLEARSSRVDTTLKELTERTNALKTLPPAEDRRLKVAEESFSEEMKSFEAQVAEYLLKSKHVSL